jgi:DNA mismatch endonuclease (patch repair protein)
MRLIAGMRTAGIKGWRRHQPLPGRPDFTFPKEKVAVFVDGCFWHGCPRHFVAPSASARFWRNKIGQNRKRDARVTRQLRAHGWRVLRIWEHALKSESSMERTINRLSRQLGSRRPTDS